MADKEKKSKKKKEVPLGDGLAEKARNKLRRRDEQLKAQLKKAKGY